MDPMGNLWNLSVLSNARSAPSVPPPIYLLWFRDRVAAVVPMPGGNV